MAHDKKDTINEEHTSRDITKLSSTLEDIDFAVYRFLDEKMDIYTNTNNGFEKVPVIWAGAERAHNIKNDKINRDTTGAITLPAIVIERTGIQKDPEKRTIPYAMIDPVGGTRGGSITINKVIKQDKTSNFANADAFRRRKQNNFPLYRRKEKNKKVVYQTLTIPIPVYVNVTYTIDLRTEYQEQMNDMLTPFIRRTNAHKLAMLEHNSNIYEAFIQGDYETDNNISKYDKDERKYQTKINIEVVGYLIGDGKNEDQPRVVTRENAVQVRFARERILVGDEDGEFRF